MTDSPTPSDNSDADVEAIAEDFLQRRRAGQNPSLEDYVAEHPDVADDLREIIPALLAMESLKHDWEETLHESDRSAGVPVEQLGDYRLLTEIGRGGMGIVYEALQESLGRRVALKLLPKHMLSSPDHVRRLHREAKTAAVLHHSNIVPVFGVGEEQGYHYIIMQLIDGASVERIIRLLREEDADDLAAALTEPGGFGPLSLAFGRLAERVQEASATEADGTVLSGLLPQSAQARTLPEIARFAESTGSDVALESEKDRSKKAPQNLPPSYWRVIAHLGIQIADAIEYAHSQGTLHRDIKPGNIMLDHLGAVWITDFGLAHASDGSDATNSQHLAGTICYMAPEQFNGQCDVRSDVYSLGLTLYEFATLTPAVSAGSRAEMIRQVTQGRPAPPRSHMPKMPRDLETIILKSIAAEPGHRYQSAEEIAADLRRFLEDRPLRARRVSVIEKAWRWCRRNPLTAASSTIAVSVLILASLISMMAYSRESAQRRKTEAMLQISIDSLERVYDRFAPDSLNTSGYSMITSTEDASDLPRAAALSPEAAAMLEELLPAFDELSTHFDDNDALKVNAAEANRRIGDIHHQLGNFEKAIGAYHQSIGRFRELKGLLRETERLVQIARVHNRVGNTYRDWQKPDEADAAFLSAIDLLTPDQDSDSRHTDSDTDKVPAAQRFELAWTHYHLGRRRLPEQFVGGHQDDGPTDLRPPNERPRFPPAREPGFPPAADRGTQNAHVNIGPGRREMMGRNKASLQLAIELLKELRRERDEAPYRFLLALCLRDTSEGFNSSAEKTALELLEKLCSEFPNQPGYRYELSQTYAAFPIRGLRSDQADNALRRMRVALEHMQRLADEHPNSVTYVFSAAHISHKYSVALGESARVLPVLERELVMREAGEMARNALELQKTAIRRSRFGVAESFWLMRFTEAYVETLRITRQFESGRKVLQDTIEIMQAELPPEQDPRRERIQQHVRLLEGRLLR